MRSDEDLAQALLAAARRAGAAAADVPVVSAPSPKVGVRGGAKAVDWRPRQDVQGLGNAVLSANVPVSGIALRLEVSRQYKQTTFSYDILGGAAVIRRDLGVKILG